MTDVARDSLPAVRERRLVSSKGSWGQLARLVQPEARDLLEAREAERFLALPLSIVHDTSFGEIVNLLVPDDKDIELLAELRFVLGKEVLLERADRELLRRAIHAVYRGGEEQLPRLAEKLKVAETSANFVSAQFRQDTEERAIPALLNALINRALAQRASDIHLEAGPERVKVRFRVDGVLCEQTEAIIVESTFADLSRRIKVLAKLDPSTPGQIQEGSFSYTGATWPVRIRVSIVPQIFAEKIVLRLLEEEEIKENQALGFTALGMSRQQEQCFRTALAQSSGVILLSGPTGSGKSTLLFEAVCTLNTKWRSIVSIEDPVERRIAGVSQSQLCSARGLGYNELLRALLRQDPDVIVLGEIRDRETAQTAFRASLSGHLLLSTVHAGNCLELLLRLEDLGVSVNLLVSTLRLLVSQRLLQTNCPDCQEVANVSPAFRKLLRISEELPLMRSVGCQACQGRGFHGRIGVYEMLPLTNKLCDHILCQNHSFWTSSSWKELRGLAEAAGYRPYQLAVRDLLLEGKVSPENALRCLGLPF